MPLSFVWSERMTHELCALALRAGDAIMNVRAGGSLGAQTKGDGSPVTCADHDSQAVILEGLRAITPNIPIIAEEQDNTKITTNGTYWLVDPLDGTRDFVRGGAEFSVNIGLVVDGAPLVGALYAPAQDDLFFGAPGLAFRMQHGTATRLSAAPAPLPDPTIRLITSHREERHYPVAKWREAGIIQDWRVCSSAYKFGLLAAAECDLFLRTGTTYEWDTAAGDALLRAIGGAIITPEGGPLAYDKPERRNGNFLAFRRSFNRAALPVFFDMLNKG